MAQLFQTFHSFLEEIVHILPDGLLLKLPRNLKVPEYLVIDALPKNYLRESRLKLQKTLEGAFQYLKEYVLELREQFKFIYEMDVHSSHDGSFELGYSNWSRENLIEKIEKYNDILYEINGMVLNSSSNLFHREIFYFIPISIIFCIFSDKQRLFLCLQTEPRKCQGFRSKLHKNFERTGNKTDDQISF